MGHAASTARSTAGTIISMGVVDPSVMGWIKAKLSDEKHDELRALVAKTDKPTHEVAGIIIEESLTEFDFHNYE